MLTRLASRAGGLGLLLVCVLALSPSRPFAAELPSGWDWISSRFRNHPLAGVIWSPAASAAVSLGALREAVVAADLALIGEIHDNADHHKIQALLLQGRRGAAVFEHIRVDQQASIERFSGFCVRARRPCTAGDLLKMLDWENSGWPGADVFGPLFGAALRARLAIVPGDAPREAVRAVAREGDVGLSSREREALYLDDHLEGGLMDALVAELEASHCGLMAAQSLAGMALAQRYRDAHLARALTQAAAKHGAAILFAGNGHVRTDRGAPWYLRRKASGKTVVSVMLLEVEDEKNDAKVYVPRGPDGRSAADFVIFTPRAERPDPCARLGERIRRKR